MELKKGYSKKIQGKMYGNLTVYRSMTRHDDIWLNENLYMYL